MSDLTHLMEAWSGEHVVIRHDPDSGAWIYIAVHSSKLGPPTGGTRLKAYPDQAAALRDALRLAEGMTYKWAVLGEARGGGKAVLQVPADFEEAKKSALLRRYGRMVEFLSGGFETGPDLGTGPAEMDIIAETTSHVFGKSPAKGGAGDPGPYTAMGVLAGMKSLCGQVFGSEDLAQRSVLVQGAGHVGQPLARLLREAGTRVLVSDVDPLRAERLAGEGCTSVSAEEAYERTVDIFAPCALGGILNARTIPRLSCRIVAGSANNQLEGPDDGALLMKRGIVYAPDYVVNAGGAIFLPSREGQGLPMKEIENRIRGIGETLVEIQRRAETEGISTDQAARRLAERNLR